MTIIMFASDAHQLQFEVVLSGASTPIPVGRGREIKRRDDQKQKVRNGLLLVWWTPR